MGPQVFTEACLAQLSSVAAQLIPPGSKQWGDAPRRYLVEAAHEILIAVGSTPAHGMCVYEPSRSFGTPAAGSWASFMACIQSDEPVNAAGPEHDSLLLKGNDSAQEADAWMLHQAQHCNIAAVHLKHEMHFTRAMRLWISVSQDTKNQPPFTRGS